MTRLNYFVAGPLTPAPPTALPQQPTTTAPVSATSTHGTQPTPRKNHDCCCCCWFLLSQKYFRSFDEIECLFTSVLANIKLFSSYILWIIFLILTGLCGENVAYKQIKNVNQTCWYSCYQHPLNYLVTFRSNLWLILRSLCKKLVSNCNILVWAITRSFLKLQLAKTMVNREALLDLA
jgi:hypothetical protein